MFWAEDEKKEQKKTKVLLFLSGSHERHVDVSDVIVAYAMRHLFLSMFVIVLVVCLVIEILEGKGGDLLAVCLCENVRMGAWRKCV